MCNRKNRTFAILSKLGTHNTTYMKLTKLFVWALLAALLTFIFASCSEDDNVYTKEGILNYSTKYLKDYSEEDEKEPPVTNAEGIFDIDFLIENEGVHGFIKNEIINDFKINTSSFSFEFVDEDEVPTEGQPTENPNAQVNKISLDLSLDDVIKHYDIEVGSATEINLINESYKELAYSLFEEIFKKGSGKLKVKTVMLDTDGNPVSGVKFHINLKANLDLYVVWNNNAQG